MGVRPLAKYGRRRMFEFQPGPRARKENEAIQVYPQTNVLALTEADMAAQTFTMELQLSFTWEDKEFVETMQTKEWQAEREKVGWMELMRETCWHPSVVVCNACELYETGDDGLPEHWYTVDEETKLVSFKCRLHGVFYEKYELADFPFDSQPLTVRMHSTYKVREPHDVRQQSRHPSSRHSIGGSSSLLGNSTLVVFEPITCKTRKDIASRLVEKRALQGEKSDLQGDKSALESVVEKTMKGDDIRKEGCILEEWHLQNLLFTRAGVLKSDTTTYPTLSVEVELHRQYTYYMQNVFFFVLLISICAFASGFVPPDAFADRCSITLTLILTIVAFKYIIAEKLPSIAYLTIADWYVIGAFLFLVLVSVENAVAAYMASGSYERGLSYEVCYSECTPFVDKHELKHCQRCNALRADYIGFSVLAGLLLLMHVLFAIWAHRAHWRSGRRSLTPHKHWWGVPWLSTISGRNPDRHHSTSQVKPAEDTEGNLLFEDNLLLWRPEQDDNTLHTWELIHKQRSVPNVGSDPFIGGRGRGQRHQRKAKDAKVTKLSLVRVPVRRLLAGRVASGS